jgi:hypothetical protein
MMSEAPMRPLVCPAEDVTMTKRRLPFVIVRDSIVVNDQSLEFVYRSDCQLDLSYSFGVGASGYSGSERISNSSGKNKNACIRPVRSYEHMNGVTLTLSGDHHTIRLIGVSEGGTGRVRVESMKLSIAGVPGDTDLVPMFAGTGASESGKSCSVCLSNDCNIALLPCRHICLCADCVDRTLSTLGNHCPVCRTLVDGRMRI